MSDNNWALENNTGRVWSTSYSSSEYHIHLNGQIDAADYYNHELKTIYSANEGDTVYVHLCTGGGSVWTACQFRTALLSCKAQTVAIIEGPCHSAGSMIALCCDGMVVGDCAYMLLHNYSGGDYGKGKELVESVKQGDKWLERLFNSIYKDFLTDKEIKHLRRDHDIHLFTDEIIERWERVIAAKEKAAEAARQESLQKVIEQAKSL